KRRRATKAIDRGPDGVTGDFCGIGKEQECPPCQCRVEEVLAGTAKNFLTNYNPETDPQGDLPKGNRRRQNQSKQNRCNEETLVDLMLAHGCKQHFPESAHDKGDEINGNKVGGPVDEVIPNTVRVVTRQRSNNGMSPVIARHGQPTFQQVSV